ncbi:MAG: TraB/GumN family protein [Bacteroidota bacterium]
MLKKKGLWLMMCWMSIAALHAQPPVRDNAGSPMIRDMQQPQNQQVLPTQALIWEVQRSDIEKPSYIYAILYKVPKDWFFLPPGLSPIVESTDRLMLETDPNYVDRDVLYRGGTPIDSTLEALLHRREFYEVNKFFQDSLSALSRYKLESRYKPLLVAQQMMQDYCLGYLRTREPFCYEQYLSQVIKKPMKILGSEWTRTPYLDAMSINQQTELLMEAYYDRHRLKAHYEEVMRAYRRQDLDAVAFLAERGPDMGGGTGRLIEAKNNAWIQTIEWHMQKESLFIAVNAAQLPGEFGLLHMLRVRGYTVTPVIY